MLESGKYYLYDDHHVVTFNYVINIRNGIDCTMFYLGETMSNVDYVTCWRITQSQLHLYVELNNDKVVTDEIRERIIRVAKRKEEHER